MSSTKEFIAIKEFPTEVRAFHWIRAFSVLGLIVTGFYIASPYLSSINTGEPINFQGALMRSWHEIFGFALIAVSISRLYLYIFSKHSAACRASLRLALRPSNIWYQIKVYSYMAKHKHLDAVYNPLQFLVYFGFSCLIFLVCLSGAALYAECYHNGLGAFCAFAFGWFTDMVGGLANLRFFHHILMWGVMLFVPCHVYMVVFNAIRWPDGGADAIISGYRYKSEQN